MTKLRLYSSPFFVIAIVTFVHACGDLATQRARVRTPSAVVAVTSGASATSVAVTTSEPPVFFTTLIERARQRSLQPDRVEPMAELPKELTGLDYQAYRSIRFRPERSLWRGEPGRFEAQFFHLGFYYREPVGVFTLARDSREPVTFPFSTQLFSYDAAPKPPEDAALGFAGMRLHAPINDAAHRDEIIVFQGASYFRTLARGEVYGLSARGLAIDTGEPTGEEFPRFSELYLVRPGPSEEAIWVLALLESRRATGAYAFRIQPGAETVIDVSARVFLREPVKVLGIAPLTSMFLFGEAMPARFGDFRPEVHDSDALALEAASGERIVRPLRNPEQTTVCTFRLDSPKGFGLLQRDRGFDSYQDLEARYQDRPSIWIEPLEDWGPGSVRLLEIATKLETDDNIAALWVPDRVPTEGLSVRYRMHIGHAADAPPSVAGRVIATRTMRTKQGMRFLVDFSAGGDVKRIDVSAVRAVIDVRGGDLVEQHIEANPFAHALRASFEVVPKAGAKDVELRAFLRRDTAQAPAATETWSYLWQPMQ